MSHWILSKWYFLDVIIAVYCAVRNAASLQLPWMTQLTCADPSKQVSAASHSRFVTSVKPKLIWYHHLQPSSTAAAPRACWSPCTGRGVPCSEYLHWRLPFGARAPHHMVVGGSTKGVLLSELWLVQVLAVMETAYFLVTTVRIRIHLCWTSWVTYRPCRYEASIRIKSLNKFTKYYITLLFVAFVTVLHFYTVNTEIYSNI